MKRPKLRHIANLWSLVGYPDAASEWSNAEKIKSVKDAGFDGIATAATAEISRMAADLGLSVVGYVSTADAKDFAPLLAAQKKYSNGLVNVQLANHDTTTGEALALALELNKAAKKLGVEAAVETHRDTCTETPEKTYALADGYRRETGELLHLTWDFSHFAVVKHLAPPFQERLLIRPDLIQRSQIFHFRPFNGHHCQVPVTDGCGNLTAELKDWLPFVEETFKVWLAGNANTDREIFVVPEMGPVAGGYNLAQLSNSWEDAVRLRPLIQEAWDRVE